MSDDANGWAEYQRLVMDKLESLERGQEKLSDKLQSVRTDVTILKTKAAGWGLIGGAIPVAIGLALHWLTGKKQ